PFGDARGECGTKRFRTHANPGLPSPGTGRNHHAGLMTLCPQTGENAGRGIIEIQQNVTGILIACVRPKVHVVAFAIADAQEAHRGGVRDLGWSPLPHAGKRFARVAPSRANNPNILHVVAGLTACSGETNVLCRWPFQYSVNAPFGAAFSIISS